MSFVHLHLHSEYSLLDGACRIPKLVGRAKELGQTAVAITDHGNMYAAVEFYNEALAQGVKPIIGCEVYVAPRTRFDKVHGQDNRPYHLILLCENMNGYQNLVKMVSLSYTEGFYSKPRVDADLLVRYHEGLIALSGCIAGQVPRLLLEGDYERAKACALHYLEIFGKNNCFLEVQNHGIRDEMRILPLLYRLSNETGIPLAASNDAHYTEKSDAEIQRVLIAIQTGTPLSQPSPLAFPTDEFYMKSEEEMREIFQNVPQAVDNTALIAERCNVEFEFGKLKLPKFTMQRVDNNTAYFKKLCEKGLEKRYGENPPKEYRERLEYEISVITRMGFVDYYLIVWDFIRYAREQHIPVGPGRGSGAGSIAAYCIGITSVDPMRYGLLFERFLNPERVSMPDFDIDFCYEGRQRVIDYVVRKYGSDRVAQIVTFGTMAAKAAVRDVDRVLELGVADRVSKLIPFGLHVTLEGALRDSPELRELYRNDGAVRRLIDTARSIEGMPRHTSTHAAGVVICDAPVSDYVPVQLSGDVIVTQYTMTVLERLGLLKMDFLGLRNLTIIRDTENFIRKRQPDFNINSIPLDDRDVYRMISEGRTTGIFQLESAGMRQTLIKLRPERIEDIIAVISLYRPGPMDSIPRYIECRHDPSKVTYKHPILQDILEETYGCIVYQEQVMEICRKMAGYSYGRADLVRRAMAKKKADVMTQERDVFVAGAVQNGVEEKIANEIFDEMASFASYAFNKSHAAAYAHICYQTAYLKCHYFKEYMAALMSAYIEHTGKIAECTAECADMGVKLLTPDVNESGAGFTPVEGGIRFALLAVKNLGENSIRELLAERQRGGKFRSPMDFASRINGRDMNQRAIESLIKCGAFDSFGYNRRELLENFYIFFGNTGFDTSGGQINFFEEEQGGTGEPEGITRMADFSLTERLDMEKEIIGIYLSGHPLEDYEPLGRLCGEYTLSRLPELRDGAAVSLFCTLEQVKPYTQRGGGRMAFVTLEDMSGEAEGMIFAQTMIECGSAVEKGRAVHLTGKVTRRDEEPKIIVDKLEPADEYAEKLRGGTLYVRCTSGQAQAMASICKEYPGGTRVILYLSDMEKKVSPKGGGVTLSKELSGRVISAAGAENVRLKHS